MTSAAREVLEDCRGALAELTDGIQGRQWRRRWITSIVLLRAVGHVLKNVDGKRSPEYRTAINDRWKHLKSTKPDNMILWSFIEEERNTILKEYQTRAGQGVTVRPGGVGIDLQTGEHKADPPLPAIYHYTINTGPFAGRDQRELIAEGIAWWEKELDAIDAAAGAA
ncbi:MAG: hypothetical protein ABI040_10365 [Rhodoferax sp.]